MTPCSTHWSTEFRRGCVPRPRLTVSEWADRYRQVPPGTSPEPGAWRTSRAPYLREILDAFSDPTVERIYIQAASQIGKSEILLSVIGYFAHQEPSPILFVQATEEAMKGFSKERIKPMFDASPALRGLLSEGARDPSNTVMLRQFPGGLLACAWAGSAASLASRPIRIVLADELDRWPDSTGRDGDPYAQAVQRTSNFFNRKNGAVSTPTIEGLSPIARLYQGSDRRQYHVPCPHCGVLQVLRWSGVIYKGEDGEPNLEDVYYRCEDCGGRIEEREKPAMLAEGEWMAAERAEDEDPPEEGTRGYQISALYSPWVRWRDLVREWLKAHADRDKRGLQEFINLRLGETWEEASEKISTEALEKNREHYIAPVPEEVRMIVAAADIQDNRIEVEARGWGAGKESWGIEYAIFPGDTATPAPWAQLDEFLQRSWTKADGRKFGLWCAVIDSGGHRTTEVYEFCRTRLERRIFAIKGYAGMGKPIVGKATTSNQLRVNLFPIGVDTGKEMVFSRLALEKPGPGYMHFPIGAGYDDEYFKGLVSEKRVRRPGKDGRTQSRWVKTHRNEPLDIAVYVTAAMEMCAPDFDDLAAKEEKARRSPPDKPSPVAPRRRILSRGVE